MNVSKHAMLTTFMKKNSKQQTYILPNSSTKNLFKSIKNQFKFYRTQLLYIVQIGSDL